MIIRLVASLHLILPCLSGLITHFALYTTSWAVLVAQLAERPPLKQEVVGLNSTGAVPFSL